MKKNIIIILLLFCAIKVSAQGLPVGTVLRANFYQNSVLMQPDGWIGFTQSGGWTFTSDPYIYTTTGSVGIGVSAPSKALHIDLATETSSQAMFGPGITSVNLAIPGITFSASSGNTGFIAGIDADNFVTAAWIDAATDYFSIDATAGRDIALQATTGADVGIGVVAPITRLHIAGTASQVITLEKIDTSVILNNAIGALNFYGGEDTQRIVAQMLCSADESWSPTVSPSRLTFWTIQSGGNILTERMRIDDTGNVGIGTALPDSGLTVENGAHFKGDVRIDGSLNVTGNESSHGEMKITGGSAYTINTTNAWHAYTGFSSEHLTSKITFDAGKSASDITAYATYDAGATTKITATAAHGLALGDIITITGTTNYNDVYEVQESVDANNFTIDKAWDTNDDATGTYAMPSCFIVGTDGAGDYKVTWTAGGSAAAADTYEFGIYHEKTLDHKIPRKFANNDVGSMAGGGIIAVVDTDVIWFAVQNTTGTNNIDIDEMSFVIHKL